MRLRTRIAVVAALAVAVAVVVVSLGAYVAARRELRSEVDASLIERAMQLERLALDVRPVIREGRLPPPLYALGGRRGPAFDTVYYQVVTPEGDLLLPRNQAPLPPVSANILENGPVLHDIRVDGVHMRMISVSVGSVGIVQTARPLTEVDATLGGLAVVLFAVGLVGTAIAGGMGLLVARSALRPIDSLTAAAEEVARTQELGARIAIESDDEIGRLASSFNAMLAALEEARAQQRRLLRDAGHELRTPLTALRTNVELLARADQLGEGERRELLDAATAEVGALSDLVAEVVDLASSRYTDKPVEAIRLDEVVERAIDRFGRRSGRRVDMRISPCWIAARRNAIDRAVSNLLENADKWSPSGAAIGVVLDDGELSVLDDGPGIDDVDKPFVFDRFYRSPSARAQPGSGLGLSIVAQIVKDHGGEVFARDADSGGAEVGFRVPVIAAPSSEEART